MAGLVLNPVNIEFQESSLFEVPFNRVVVEKEEDGTTTVPVNTTNTNNTVFIVIIHADVMVKAAIK